MSVIVPELLAYNGDINMWANDSVTLPDWMNEHMLGIIEPNGTFPIKTALGNARVHRGNVVIVHRDAAYTCEPAETFDLVNRLRAEENIALGIAVGPGKRLDRSGAGPAPGRRPGKRRRMAYSKPIGTMPSIEWVHIERLSIDTGYQRSINNAASRRLIGSIAANFDWRLCAPLVVSRRPTGELFVIDGQHRTMAAQQRGDILQLPCCLFSYAGPEEEAQMFIAANRARKPMNRLDDFHAALAAMDDDAIEIDVLVTQAGLKVARNTASESWQPKEIAFVATIATSLRRHGSPVVSAALTNVAEAFPAERLTHSGSVFLGLVKIFAHPPEAFDPDQLFDALKEKTAAQWCQSVVGLNGGEARAFIVRNALIAAYDAKILAGCTS